MRKFIEIEKSKLEEANSQHMMSMENVLRQMQTYLQTLIVEVSSQETTTESTEHAMRGLLALDDFIRKNIDISMLTRDRASLLGALIQEYDKNKKLAEKITDDDQRKFRKIGEKPDSLRQTRNLRKDLDLYIDGEDLPEGDS